MKNRIRSIREVLAIFRKHLPTTQLLPQSCIEAALACASLAASNLDRAGISLQILAAAHTTEKEKSRILIFENDGIEIENLPDLIYHTILETDEDVRRAIVDITLNVCRQRKKSDSLIHQVFARLIDLIQDEPGHLEIVLDYLEQLQFSEVHKSIDLSSDWISFFSRLAYSFNVNDHGSINPELENFVKILKMRSKISLVKLFQSMVTHDQIQDAEKTLILSLAVHILAPIEATGILVSVLRTESSSEVRIAAMNCLVKMDLETSIVEELMDAVLYDPAAGIRRTALDALASISDRMDLLQILSIKIKDKSKTVREAAMAHINTLLRKSNDVPADFQAAGLNLMENEPLFHDYLRDNIDQLFDGTFMI